MGANKMRVCKAIREIRCEDLIKGFLHSDKRKSCVFFTLTTPDVVDYETIRFRWRHLRHFLVEKIYRRSGVKPKYVMNYEIHPKGHGWHIHSVWDCFIDLKSNLAQIRSFGFGRVDVRRVYREGVALYLSKHCLKSYRGLKKKDETINRLRLVNCSRGLPRLSDYRVLDRFKSQVSLFRKRCLKFGYHQFNDLAFTQQWQVSEIACLLGCVFPSEVAKKCLDILNGDFDIKNIYVDSYENTFVA